LATSRVFLQVWTKRRAKPVTFRSLETGADLLVVLDNLTRNCALDDETVAERFMSVRQIAKQLGVSAATVSRAMNNHPAVGLDVRKRVLAAVSRSGYVSNVGKGSTTNIAF